MWQYNSRWTVGVVPTLFHSPDFIYSFLSLSLSLSLSFSFSLDTSFIIWKKSFLKVSSVPGKLQQSSDPSDSSSSFKSICLSEIIWTDGKEQRGLEEGERMFTLNIPAEEISWRKFGGGEGCTKRVRPIGVSEGAESPSDSTRRTGYQPTL